MKRTLLICLLTILSIQVQAQTKKEKDIEAIKKMSGCFKVDFNFAETFNYSKDSTYKASKQKHDSALEYAKLIVDKDNKLSIQHLLIVGKPGEEMIIKHWRQDWLYENTDFYMYDGDNNWRFAKKEKENVKGQWTQKVYQVDDSPRYEGSSTWVHVDGKSYWENTTPAPLPRREYTKRRDYNITLRGNRHEITNYGWVHDQDNKKVIRKKGEKDFVLAEEKGYNPYVRVEDSKCKVAKKWWSENKSLWKKVRKNWTNLYERNQDMYIKPKVKGRKLHRSMFKLKATAKNKEIKEILKKYVN